MTYNEKKSLYESIMKDVAKSVKRQINEADNDNIEDTIKDLENQGYEIIKTKHRTYNYTVLCERLLEAIERQIVNGKYRKYYVEYGSPEFKFDRNIEKGKRVNDTIILNPLFLNALISSHDRQTAEKYKGKPGPGFYDTVMDKLSIFVVSLLFDDKAI